MHGGLVENWIFDRCARQLKSRTKISEAMAACFLMEKRRLFSSHFPSAVKRTIKTQNNAEVDRQQNHFNVAIGYYELGMFDESQAELNKIEPCIAAQSVPVLALRLMISYSRSNWNEMKARARNLFLLDPSNPQWAFSDGYATAKIDSVSKKD
jgi:hypothetical protein